MARDCRYHAHRSEFPNGNPSAAKHARRLALPPVFDLHGRLVRTLVETQVLTAGLHEVTIDGRGQRGGVLASGVYFYRVEIAEEVVTGRVAVLK